MQANREAIIYTLQSGVRGTIQSIVYCAWAYVLTAYAWPSWEAALGYRYTSLELFFVGDPRTGWLGALAALFGVSLGLRGLRIFLTITVPFALKRKRLQELARREVAQ